MRTSAAGFLSLILATGSGLVPARAQDAGSADGPLSALDWLSQSVATAATTAGTGVVDEPPVAEAGSALPSTVTTSSLDGPSPDGVGLIPTTVSGLPRDLWGAGMTREIAESLVAHPDEDLPALRQLFLTLLLAEVAAPVDAGGRGELLLVWGRQDPHIPAEGRRLIYDSLTAAGTSFTWHEFNGEHAFMRDEGHRYDPALAQTINGMVSQHLTTHLKS